MGLNLLIQFNLLGDRIHMSIMWLLSGEADLMIHENLQQNIWRRHSLWHVQQSVVFVLTIQI